MFSISQLFTFLLINTTGILNIFDHDIIEDDIEAQPIHEMDKNNEIYTSRILLLKYINEVRKKKKLTKVRKCKLRNLK